MDSFSDINEDRALAEMLDSESYQNMERQSQLQDDYAFAQMLESQYAVEDAHSEVQSFIPPEFINGSPKSKYRHDKREFKTSEKSKAMSIIAPEWEDLDPTPDLHALFIQYNDRFFWGKLAGCEVKWSPKMTSCAGVCSYQGKGGLCSVRLSLPLLKLRPRKDLVETLLHEMIHAYLFITDGNDNHDGHGPAFHEHMFRINKETGTKISVYHNFHDEVAVYKQHWWKCNGPCVNRKPFYGIVKRSMNRAPGPYDIWWKQHQNLCGGTYSKIKEPDGYGNKTAKKKEIDKSQKDIRSFVKSNVNSNDNKRNNGNNSGTLLQGGGRGNIFGFGGSSFTSPSGVGMQTKGRAGARTVNPGWKTKDNSLGGHVVKVGNNSKNSGVDIGKNINSLTNSSGRKASTSTEKVSAPEKVNLDDTSDKVRQKLRDVWTKRQFITNNLSDNNSSGSVELNKNMLAGRNQKDIEKDSVPQDSYESHCESVQIVSETIRAKKINCPVCDKNVIEENINAHLDGCLNSESVTKTMPVSCNARKRKTSGNPFLDDSDDPSPEKNNTLSPEETSSYTCLICNREVLIAEMEYHINMCIDK